MEIGFPTLLGILLLPAVTFALAYAPIVSRFSRGLVSPYAKADVRKRFSAALVDGLLAITLSFGYWTSNSPLYLAVGAGYLLLRDAIGGQSVGKLVLGLVVIDLMTGRAASLSASARRNLLLLLPGANLAAVFLEARTIAVDPQGQRLGDRLAHTQVVEGAGARDLVKSFQDWLTSLGRGLGQATGGRRRVPGRIDRAHLVAIGETGELQPPAGAASLNLVAGATADHSDPSARTTWTKRSSSRPDTWTRHGLQHTSQS